ncbi:LysE family translocator [Haladaptatus pallidirubidus]|uniref:LysE family translocator n=1 Tax=Haladaptatus pallidirubidus TaxID=1008152 RepID=UPI001D0FDDB0|nr:LysE family translocator [Haladaptatus pallidirubidus]
MLIISPVPDSIYTLTRSISDGRTVGVTAALGSSTGSIVHTTAAVLGLSAIFQTSAVAYTIVKLVGAAYLVYLGVQTFRTTPSISTCGGWVTAYSTSERYLHSPMRKSSLESHEFVLAKNKST